MTFLRQSEQKKPDALRTGHCPSWARPAATGGSEGLSPKTKARCSSHRALPLLGSNQDSSDPEAKGNCIWRFSGLLPDRPKTNISIEFAPLNIQYDFPCSILDTYVLLRHRHTSGTQFCPKDRFHTTHGVEPTLRTCMTSSSERVP
jgi:hypothetical protein